MTAPQISAPPSSTDNLRAMGIMVISVIASSAMTLFVRELSQVMDTRLIVFYRAFLTMLVMIAIIAIIPARRQAIRITRPAMHFWRGLAIAVSTHLGYFAISRLELVTATVIFFSAPIFAAVFGAILHGERPGVRRITAICVGFLGVLFVLRPGVVSFDPAMLAALSSSLLFGFALPLSREVANADGTWSAYFSSLVVTVVVSLPIIIPIFTLPQTAMIALLVILTTASGATRSICDIRAYQLGEASVLAPVTYTRLIFIGIGGYLIFGEVPDQAALIGAAIIIGAALYIARRQAIARRRRALQKM